MRNIEVLQQKLQRLGLSPDEAAIFMQLLDSPKTQLEISRATGIARSNVYRIVDGMVEKSLVREQTTEEGRLIASAHPEALELLVLEQETAAETKRDELTSLLPLLKTFQSRDELFAIRTYTGIGGLKQMLWNELKTQGEVLVFSGRLLDEAVGKRWADKYREEIIRRRISERCLINKSLVFPKKDQYQAYYHIRSLDDSILAIESEIAIYDTTIAIYSSLDHDIQLGVEVTSPFFSAFMRQVFEEYWEKAG